MPIDWIKKLLSRKGSKRYSRKKVPAQVNASPALKRNSKTLFRKYSRHLETSFFASVLDTPQDAFLELSKAQQLQVSKIAEVVSRNHLTLDKLPRKPSSLPMLLKLLKIDDLPYEKISAALLNDPALTTKILTTANSPYFKSGSKAIESLEQAILLLGTGGLKKVISAAIVEPVLAEEGGRGEFSRQVWQWALMSAEVNDQFSRNSGRKEGALYLLGLLPALSLMLVHRSIDEFEFLSGKKKVHPSIRKEVVKKLCWKVCLEVREQWGLPEEYGEYLIEAEKPLKEGKKSALRDAVVLATHIYLNENDESPLKISQLCSLTSSDMQQLTSIVKSIKRKLSSN